MKGSGLVNPQRNCKKVIQGVSAFWQNRYQVNAVVCNEAFSLLSKLSVAGRVFHQPFGIGISIFYFNPTEMRRVPMKSRYLKKDVALYLPHRGTGIPVNE
jgi:hypothetical protein